MKTPILDQMVVQKIKNDGRPYILVERSCANK